MAVVLRPDLVDASVAELLSARIHPHFAGYLCLVRTAARDGSTEKLPGEFKDFFETFFRVPNGTDELPYLRPFWNTGSDVRAWNQPNVAGTYAASSVRPGMPFSEVVLVEGAGRAATYSLRDGHAALALAHLAGGQKVPVAPLAAYLYRDYSFNFDGEPSLAGVVDVFKYEFGYRPEEGATNEDFDVLFVDESQAGNTSDQFEELV
jgi:hypothetical protein